MIVVSDTSPLSALMAIKHDWLLRDLFAQVYVPQAVHDELLRGHSVIPEYIETISVRNMVDVARLANQLDKGEAEAIVLAKEIHSALILMDEKLGRIHAEHEGLQVIGSMGVLLLSKQKGLIPSVKDLIARMRSEAGFRLSKGVESAVLTAAGEKA